MSSISISGTGQGLFSFLQQISGNTQSQATDSTSSASGSGTTASATTVTADGQSASTGAVHHHHHGGHGGFAKVQQAVSDALQSAGSDGSADPNQVVTDAIAKLFGGGNTSADPSNPATAADPDGDTGAPGQSGAASANSAQQAFSQLLQSYGIDSKQFHQDFLNAVKKAQGGEIDPSSAFQSVPPGANVDTTG